MPYACFFEFQSTPSSRRETNGRYDYSSSAAYFNPLPPRGGRLLPVEGAERIALISIHSLLAEGDLRF